MIQTALLGLLVLSLSSGQGNGTPHNRNLESTDRPRVNREMEPDPKGVIVRDRGEFVRIEAISDSPNPTHRPTIRFRVILHPNTRKKARWNDSAGNIKLWINWPEGWKANRYDLLDSNLSRPDNWEVRQIEFEAQPPEKAGSAEIVIPGYAVYFICEEVHFTCMLRRQDFNFRISSK